MSIHSVKSSGIRAVMYPVTEELCKKADAYTKQIRMQNMRRRHFVRLSAMAGLFGLASKSRSEGDRSPDGLLHHSSGTLDDKSDTPLKRTPAEIKGPFYPLVAQNDKNFDLTKIDGNAGVAIGTHVYIEGTVFDSLGNTIEDATVDLWQANTHGRYRHPYDSSDAPMDENFQGWAIIQTDQAGKFKFKTVMPGPYSVSSNWQRPPHIHFKVTKLGYEGLITQMYFPEQILNATDSLLQKKAPEEQALMIAKRAEQKKNGLEVFRYDIFLEQT